MTDAAVLRALALAAVALLALAVALALLPRRQRSSSLPQPAGRWRTALAASYPATGRKGACGIVIDASTPGVAHPTLPCGVKLYLEVGGKEVLTEVVDRSTGAPAPAFRLTQGLAALLGLHGTETVRWRFAR